MTDLDTATPEQRAAWAEDADRRDWQRERLRTIARDLRRFTYAWWMETSFYVDDRVHSAIWDLNAAIEHLDY